MKKINLWESKINDYYIFFNSVDEYFNYLIENNKNISFRLQDGYNFGDEEKSLLDSKCTLSEVSARYTDNEHPIAVSTFHFFDTYIDPKFFSEHKEEFIKKSQEYILYLLDFNKSSYISIPDYVNKDDFLLKIINHKVSKNVDFEYDSIVGEVLSQDLIKIIKDNHLEFSISSNKVDVIDKKISTRYIFNNCAYFGIGYTIDELKEKKEIQLDVSLIEYNDLINFKYINPNTIIKFKNNGMINEDKYFSDVIKIFEELSKYNNNYIILISVDNRQKLKDSKLIDMLPTNVKLVINNDFHDYDLEEYKQEEEKLERLVEPIKSSNLSPLEKFIAVYNIVKKFKKYKEKEEYSSESRKLRYILDNDYIVCVGFAKLLNTLLDKVGIECKDISVDIDPSYDKGFTMENTPVFRGGHARNLVYIKDKKYNIDGYYITDSTWDNDLENDLYLNSLMTFNRKKEARRLEFLSDEDLLLDINNFEDFNLKINYFIKKEFKNSKHKYIIVRNIFDKILGILNRLDHEKYEEFYIKYNERLNELESDEKNLELLFNEILNDYANYIIPRTNREIDEDVFLEAIVEVKRKVDKLSTDELQLWFKKMKQVNKEYELKGYPYVYNSDIDREAYLVDRKSYEITTRKM